MDKPLSQEAQSRIGELCESIARRDLLDVDAQEELRGHIEDKVIAYLEGREALTELDAVVLAREHFGSPDTSESYLHAFHLNRLDANVVRRLAQLVFISYAIQFIAVLMLRTFLNGNPLAAFVINLKPLVLTPELMVATSGLIVVSVACVLVALRKAAALRRFQDVSTRTTATRAFIAFALSAILPTWWRTELTPVTNWLVALTIIHVIFSLISCYTWLWWVDRLRGSLAHLAAAACAWLGMIMLHPIVARFVQAGGRLAFGDAYINAYAGTFRTFAIHPFTSFQFGLNGSGLTISFLMLACVVYGVVVWKGRPARGDVALAD